MGRPEADSGRAAGGGGMGRPVADIGPGGRGGGVELGAPGAPDVLGGRGAGGGPAAGRSAGVMGRADTVGVGRPLEMNPELGRGASGATGSATGATGVSTTGAGAGASTTGSGVSTTGAGAGDSTTGAGVSTTGAGAETLTTGASTTGAGVSTAGAGAETSATSSTFFATAFFGAAAFFAAAFFTGLPSLSTSSVFGAAAFFAAAFLTGLGSSGCSSRINPSRSARRRTRSACASMIDEEWLLMSMPMAKHKSTASLLVRPSSLASSWTRIFFGKCDSAFPSHARVCQIFQFVQRHGHVRSQRATQVALCHRGVRTRRRTANPRASPLRCDRCRK